MCLPEICGLGDTKCVNVIVKDNPPTGGESEKPKKLKNNPSEIEKEFHGVKELR
jgi:hypothetical protein